MNYHNDTWIKRKVKQHLSEAQTLIPTKYIVGIFLQGSQNYGLDYENSDVDTKCITLPSFKDIVLARKPISTTHIRDNNEHIDLKDIRLYFNTFRKQNVNFLEILFTPYKYINLRYEQEWQRLIDNREAIAHYNLYKSAKAMLGTASEKYYAMEHRYPSKIEVIDEFGYDPKQLSHLLRISEFLQRYINNESYEDCLLTRQSNYLKQVKSGLYTLDQAREIATQEYDKIHTICDNFTQNHKNDKDNAQVDELLDDVGYNIMKISVQQEFDN